MILLWMLLLNLTNLAHSSEHDFAIAQVSAVNSESINVTLNNGIILTYRTSLARWSDGYQNSSRYYHSNYPVQINYEQTKPTSLATIPRFGVLKKVQLGDIELSYELNYKQRLVLKIKNLKTLKTYGVLRDDIRNMLDENVYWFIQDLAYLYQERETLIPATPQETKNQITALLQQAKTFQTLALKNFDPLEPRMRLLESQISALAALLKRCRILSYVSVLGSGYKKLREDLIVSKFDLIKLIKNQFSESASWFDYNQDSSHLSCSLVRSNKNLMMDSILAKLNATDLENNEIYDFYTLNGNEAVYLHFNQPKVIQPVFQSTHRGLKRITGSVTFQNDQGQLNIPLTFDYVSTNDREVLDEDMNLWTSDFLKTYQLELAKAKNQILELANQQRQAYHKPAQNLRIAATEATEATDLESNGRNQCEELIRKKL